MPLGAHKTAILAAAADDGGITLTGWVDNSTGTGSASPTGGTGFDTITIDGTDASNRGIADCTFESAVNGQEYTITTNISTNSGAASCAFYVGSSGVGSNNLINDPSRADVDSPEATNFTSDVNGTIYIRFFTRSSGGNHDVSVASLVEV